MIDAYVEMLSKNIPHLPYEMIASAGLLFVLRSCPAGKKIYHKHTVE
jgi:hypothetical protein